MSSDNHVHSAQQPACLQCKRYQQQLSEQADMLAAFASELAFIQQWVGNPNVRDKEKVGGIAYYMNYYETQARSSDGFRYYSRERVAGRLGNVKPEGDKPGNKEQSFGSTHALLKRNGLIDSKKEPQKSNKSRMNLFDKITPQWELNAGGVVIDYGNKAGNHGGKRERIILHRECGGEVFVSHTCTKCGEIKLQPEAMLTIDREKWQRWMLEQAEEEAYRLAEAEEERIIPPALTMPTTPPPDYECGVCNVRAWSWDGTAGQYYCRNHQKAS